MSNMNRGVRDFKLYLLPGFLFAIAGALLMGLLYYPLPSTQAAVDHPTLVVADENGRRLHAEDLFAILLADALRQLREQQDNGAHTLRYHPAYPRPSGEWPVLLPILPPCTQFGRATDRPSLIYL